MGRFAGFLSAIAGSVALLMLVPLSSAGQVVRNKQLDSAGSGGTAAPAKPSYSRAFVIDDRLSALRREPGFRTEVIRRVRLGRLVFIIRGRSEGAGDSKFYRIAVTRRTRGWIHQSALAVQGRPGEDQRLMNLIEVTPDGFDRIVLCRILIERFGRSPLVPRALLLMGEEAERAAETLSLRARRRIPNAKGASPNASLRAYYLNDPWLDRYSRLRVVFDFNEAACEYVYDGRAYREVLKRFPTGQEAVLARQRLNRVNEKMARRH